MKKQTKNKRSPAAMTAVIALTLAAAVSFLTACGGGGEPPPPKPQAKAQTGTIEVNLKQKCTVTVKGDSFTDAEWNTIKTQLVTAINDAYNAALPGTARIKFDSIFIDQPGGVTINVDKTPSGYTNWKTIGDEKTLYIANGKINKDNITAGVSSMDAGGEATAQVIQAHDLFVRRAAA